MKVRLIQTSLKFHTFSRDSFIKMAEAKSSQSEEVIHKLTVIENDDDAVPSTSNQNPHYTLLPDERVFEDVNDSELLAGESEVDISMAVDDHDSPQPTINSPIDDIINHPQAGEKSPNTVRFDEKSYTQSDYASKQVTYDVEQISGNKTLLAMLSIIMLC